MVSDGEQRTRWRVPRRRTIVLVGAAAVVALWIVPWLIEAIDLGDGLPEIDLSRIDHPYLLIAGFVAFDTIIPILPSESLLTAASTAAAASGRFDLGAIVLAGWIGAWVGDTMLYWLSRTLARPLVAPRLEAAQQNEKVAAAFQVLGESAPLLIMLGRFVPGVRFAVGASMGIGRYPYPRFLLWTVIGGGIWASYTCVFSYLIGQRLGGYPVLSFATSALVTGVIVLLMYFPLKRRYDRARAQQVA
jgi:membrane-associated protein